LILSINAAENILIDKSYFNYVYQIVIEVMNEVNSGTNGEK